MEDLFNPETPRDVLLQKACVELDRRLQAGDSLVVETMLAAYPMLAAEPDSALQLIYDELVLRERRGEQPDYGEYYARFPQWENELRKSFDIHEALVRRDSTFVASAPEAKPGWHRYQLLGELGRGGMGVVYKARQPGLNRIVALKMILASEYASLEELDRFRREAEIIARLQHPNIVQVYEVGEQDGRPFLALEYVDGGSLEARLKGTPLPPRDAARLVETLAQAVQYAHEHGVLHRDLKPANILLMSSETESDERLENSSARTSNAFCTLLQPKITDFGLAKRLPGSQEVSTTVGKTQTGEILGTPSYMAPEQTEGLLHATGPTTDVYALGAILYETLTGRPPFRGESALETLLQARHQEPVSPMRLNPKVPRDLETICLKCLQKEPTRRYASAAALAEELARFREGLPLVARPVGRVEHAWRWCKRNPREAVILVLAAALLVLGIGGGWSLERQRLLREFENQRHLEQTRQRLEASLAQLPTLGRFFLWEDAQALLARAETDARLLGLDAWQQRVQQAQRDWHMAKWLDQIRLHEWLLVEGKIDHGTAATAYAAAFAWYGLELQNGDAAALADRVKTSAIREELLFALHDWALKANKDEQQEKILAVVHAADSGQWPRSLRDRSSSRPKLEQLASSADFATWTPAMVTRLARWLEAQGGDAISLRRQAQQHHPRDFWLSFELAVQLHKRGESERREALGYFRLAVTLRPEVAIAHYNLGVALQAEGNLDAAIVAWRRAVELDPQLACAHVNLGCALRIKGDRAGAIAALRRAIDLDGNLAGAYANLGLVLRDGNDLEGATTAFREALRINPNLPEVHGNLGLALLAGKKLAEAVLVFRQAADRFPDSAKAHNNLGSALARTGDLLAAVAAFRRAAELDENFSESHFNLGLALLNLKQWNEAVKAFRRTLALEPKHVQALNNLGLALQAAGDKAGAIAAWRRAVALDGAMLDAHLNLGAALGLSGDAAGAVATLRRAVELAPDSAKAYSNLGAALRDHGDTEGAIAACREAVRLQEDYAEAHCGLGFALRDAGQFVPALASLRRGQELYAGEPTKSQLSTRWVRDCERLVSLHHRWPAVLEDSSVKEIDDLLTLAELCRRWKRHYVASVRFYEAGFRIARATTDDHFYRAAKAAALAAAGAGLDSGNLSEADKVRLRRQALQWLRSPLAMYGRMLERDANQHSFRVHRVLNEWLRNPDLVSVRDPAELARLPMEQHQEWLKLWKEVARLHQVATDSVSRHVEATELEP